MGGEREARIRREKKILRVKEKKSAKRKCELILKRRMMNLHNGYSLYLPKIKGLYWALN